MFKKILDFFPFCNVSLFLLNFKPSRQDLLNLNEFNSSFLSNNTYFIEYLWHQPMFSISKSIVSYSNCFQQRALLSFFSIYCSYKFIQALLVLFYEKSPKGRQMLLINDYCTSFSFINCMQIFNLRNHWL